MSRQSAWIQAPCVLPVPVQVTAYPFCGDEVEACHKQVGAAGRRCGTAATPVSAIMLRIMRDLCCSCLRGSISHQVRSTEAARTSSPAAPDSHRALQGSARKAGSTIADQGAALAVCQPCRPFSTAQWLSFSMENALTSPPSCCNQICKPCIDHVHADEHILHMTWSHGSSSAAIRTQGTA